MTMDHPVFIAILGGLIVALLLVGFTERAKRLPHNHEHPPSPFDEAR